MRWAKFLLLALGILVLGWGVDQLLHLEENRVLKCVQQAAMAVEAKDFEKFSRCLTQDFQYDSKVHWIPKGNLEGARSKLGEFWGRSGFISVILRESLIEIQKKELRAAVHLKGLVKFSYDGGGFALYQFQADLHLQKPGENWEILRAEILELKPWSL